MIFMRITGLLGAAAIGYGATWLYKNFPREFIDDRINRIYEISRASRAELYHDLSRSEHANLIGSLSWQSKGDFNQILDERSKLNRESREWTYLNKTFKENNKESTLVFYKYFGRYIYAGSTDNLFDFNARQEILNGNYIYIYPDFDLKKTRTQKCIITGVKGYLESREEEIRFNDRLIKEYIVSSAKGAKTRTIDFSDWKVSIQGEGYSNWKYTEFSNLSDEEKEQIINGNFSQSEGKIKIPAFPRISSYSDDAIGS